MATPANIFADLDRHSPDEQVSILLDVAGVRVERIVSHGHASPAGFWYDQDHSEWVIVLKGAAKLRFEGEPQPIELRAGDFIDIPAHTRHRVEWTTADEPTLWLAVHYGCIV